MYDQDLEIEMQWRVVRVFAEGQDLDEKADRRRYLNETSSQDSGPSNSTQDLIKTQELEV